MYTYIAPRHRTAQDGLRASTRPARIAKLNQNSRHATRGESHARPVPRAKKTNPTHLI